MNNVVLIGADDVSRAGSTMREAAREMNSAASSLSFTLEQHQRFLDDWLMRFENIMTTATTAVAVKDNG